MPQRFGEKLRLLRHQHTLTQSDLADRLGLVSQAHIANVEAGRDAASLDLVIRVATLFSVTTDYLLRNTIPIQEVVSSTPNPIPHEKMLPELLGNKLRSLRLKRGLSQTELAHQLGLARRGYI